MRPVFECRRCGFCCQGESTVSLSAEEITRIAAFLGISVEDLFRKYLVKKGKRVEMRTVEGHCIFYEPGESLCRIHAVKPEHCRRWPLHPSILKDPESFEIIRASCPGFREDARWEEVCEALRDEQTG